MLIAAATFLITFAAVCAIGYLLFLRSGRESQHQRGSDGGRIDPAAGTRSFADRELSADDGQRQVAIEQKMLHTIAWLRRLRGAPPLDSSVPLPTGPAPGVGVKVLLAVVMVAVAVGMTLALIAGSLEVLGWLEEPILDPIFNALFALFLHPAGAALLAGSVLAAGLPLARRFRRPERFRTGVWLMAASIGTFWPIQMVAGSFNVPFWEYEAFLRGVGAFISAGLFTGGFESVRRAMNTPGDDSWEFMR